jgi:GH15 family glucan-1,4-alpha-glucosidase
MLVGQRLEDYAVIGDTQTLALVGRNGAIDWLCLPRFDSAACFAALLGEPEHGRFVIRPRGEITKVERCYRDHTLILETTFTTPTGAVRIVDFMPIRGAYPDVVRIVEGVSGSVELDVELVLRFGYGRVLPWVRRLDGRLHAIAGPDAVVLATPVRLRGRAMTSVAELTVREGDRVPFVLTWYPSFHEPPESPDADDALADTETYWTEWIGRHAISGKYKDPIIRSIITLKALTYAPTGGIVAAGTTSLPEQIGGERNWDYRFCWLRDATFTLYALMHAGYTEEARAWRDWLLRAVAGDPKELQTMYGPAGERDLGERELDLPGYEGSRPVRVGNAAADQLQLDIYGELLDALHQARRMGVPDDENAWRLQKTICDWLDDHWQEKDRGIWEIRGKSRALVHSKVMAWVALDRAIKEAEANGRGGPIDKWRATRAKIHREVCERGFDRDLGGFVQFYGAKHTDASLLLIPMVGFLPADDPRVKGTVALVEKTLVKDGFVLRYPTETAHEIDGLHGTEGAFLACSFWLVDALALQGRHAEAQELYERLLAVRNDVGLLSEEYDTEHQRLVGNFPQAFSHVALVNSGRTLSEPEGAAEHRGRT